MRRRSRRIAIAKPDWGIRGGFEVVVERIVEHLRGQGDEVLTLAVPAPARSDHVFGQPVDAATREAAPELVNYLGLVEEFGALDAHRADLVISTQPPSFAVPAARHLALFFHHARVFYDLAEVATEAGVLSRREATIGVPAVRRIDQDALEQVTWFLAGSPTVRRRLETFNGLVSNVGLFLAGTRGAAWATADAGSSRPVALCVSRHEFAKRTELFVRAMALVPEVEGASVGVGGRRGYVQRLAADPHGADAALTDRQTWCRAVPWSASVDGRIGRLTFAGYVADDELERWYRGATCVVAPAYDEDYGLTALEAMEHGKPVVVCVDGGGLVDLVEHERTGLVVEPTAVAIAAAIERLTTDRDLAAELGRQGREVAASYTWEGALRHLDEAIEHVMVS